MIKYFSQFTIICLITFVGELLAAVLPLSVPGSIYGMFLMFLALCTGIVKMEQIQETADFLLAVMPVMFVPAAVSLITKWDILKNNIIGFLITCIVSTILVMGITGISAQALLKKRGKNKHERDI